MLVIHRWGGRLLRDAGDLFFLLGMFGPASAVYGLRLKWTAWEARFPGR